MPRKPAPLVDLVRARVVETPGPLSTPCWITTLYVNPYGYAQIRGRGAHRVTYAALVGPIPDGYEIDHLCRVTACVNPDHLEAVTPHENKRRSNAPSAISVRTNTCYRGHSLEDAYRNGAKKRSCRVCRAVRLERYRVAG